MTGRSRSMRVAAALTAAGTLLLAGCTTQGASAPPAAPPAAPVPSYAATLQPSWTSSPRACS